MRELIEDGRVHLFDGAMGTLLYSRGIFVNVCYDELTLGRPELVRKIHQEYVHAGAEIIETNTFGANPVKLSSYGLAERTEEINAVAARLAREATGVGEQAKAETQLTQAMSNFFLVVENYPDLKANENFLSLQEELTSTENKIGFARQFYNDETMKFNTRIEMFPSNIVAGTFSFQQSEFFEIEDAAEREVPKVSF